MAIVVNSFQASKDCTIAGPYPGFTKGGVTYSGAQSVPAKN